MTISATDAGARGVSNALFGSGGGLETAKRLSALVGSDVPLLAKVPFDSELQGGGDSGTPVYLSVPDGPIKNIFDELLTRLMISPRSLVGIPLSLHT